MEVVAVDILGPLPESTAGNVYVLVAADYFTKWVEAFAIPNQEAITVAKKLTDQMFCRFSPPEQLHSDQGRQFESDLLKEICDIFQIKKSRTTPYHPQCDGQVERFNRTLLHMLTTTLKGHPFDWEDHLAKVCMAYNTSIHSTTGFSPYFLMFGRKPRLPLDLVYPTAQGKSTSTQEYAHNVRLGLESAYLRVRDHLQSRHDHRKEYYDRKIHGKPYAVGDLVWLHSSVIPKGTTRKFHHPWTGPYKISTKLSDADYRITDVSKKRPPQVVHFNRLKRCAPGTRFLQNIVADEPISPELQTCEEISYHFGETLDIVDDLACPTNHRYPSRNRHPPDRYGPRVYNI